jgi:hypothetical protein
MNQADLERLNGYDILHLARATRNAAFVEEYRKRNCARRNWDLCELDKVHAEIAREPCDCWACERYGLGGYCDFQCHPDFCPPQDWPGGECWCWVCDMGRYDGSAYEE